MTADQASEARDRLAVLLPDATVHASHAKRVWITLRADHAAALAARLTEGAAAVEAVGRISDAIDDMPHTRDCAWWNTPPGEDACDCIRGHLRDVLDATPPQPDAAQVAEPAQGEGSL